MKKYICINKIILLLLIIGMTSCEGKFILDPIDPRLPKYTESGNDAAGAFIDKEIWKSVVGYGLFSSSYKPYISSYPGRDSLMISFEGAMGLEAVYIEFHIQNFAISSLTELSSLRNKKIQLDGVNNYGFIRDNNTPYPSPSIGGIGQLYIKNVSLNATLDKAVISGTFGFTTADSTGVTREVSYGRFDYTFTDNQNFIVF